MAAEIKTREQLRPRFANGKKPPQEDFYNWMESFWHKHDDIDAGKVKTSIGGQKVDILTLMNNIGQRITNIELNLEWAEL